MKPFNKYFDHTLLKPEATSSDVLKIIMEAVNNDFASVCVNGSHVRSAARFLKISGADVKVAAVVGFPLGAMATKAKVYEAKLAIVDGAQEIDMVMDIGQGKMGNWLFVEDEVKEVADLCHSEGVTLKVIIETCYLTDDEIVKAVKAACLSGADYVKTSTGFGPDGANVDDIALMKKTIEELGIDVKIKASGGIRSLAEAKAMIAAGADRLGCSASVKIMEEYNQSNR